MSRDPHLGTYTYCSRCGRRFWTEVGESQCYNCERNGYHEPDEDETEDEE